MMIYPAELRLHTAKLLDTGVRWFDVDRRWETRAFACNHAITRDFANHRQLNELRRSFLGSWHNPAEIPVDCCQMGCLDGTRKCRAVARNRVELNNEADWDELRAIFFRRPGRKCGVRSLTRIRTENGHTGDLDTTDAVQYESSELFELIRRRSRRRSRGCDTLIDGWKHRGVEHLDQSERIEYELVAMVKDRRAVGEQALDGVFTTFEQVDKWQHCTDTSEEAEHQTFCTFDAVHHRAECILAVYAAFHNFAEKFLKLLLRAVSE